MKAFCLNLCVLPCGIMKGCNDSHCDSIMMVFQRHSVHINVLIISLHSPSWGILGKGRVECNTLVCRWIQNDCDWKKCTCITLVIITINSDRNSNIQSDLSAASCELLVDTRRLIDKTKEVHRGWPFLSRVFYASV